MRDTEEEMNNSRTKRSIVCVSKSNIGHFLLNTDQLPTGRASVLEVMLAVALGRAERLGAERPQEVRPARDVVPAFELHHHHNPR